MRTGVGHGHHGLRMVVRQRSDMFDIERVVSYDAERFGESGETTETITDISMWVYEPNAVDIDTEYGDRLSGELRGLAMADADIQRDDAIIYDGAPYEVNEIIYLPDSERRELMQFGLTKVTNDR